MLTVMCVPQHLSAQHATLVIVWTVLLVEQQQPIVLLVILLDPATPAEMVTIVVCVQHVQKIVKHVQLQLPVPHVMLNMPSFRLLV